MNERWLPVVGYEGLYEVSDQGRVWSIRSGISLKPSFNKRNGKLSVTLPGKPRRHRYVHQLVLEAFVGPCPAGKESCHANDVGTDNRLVNLRWDTRSANKFDEARNGIHRNARKTECPKHHKYTTENTAYRPNRNGVGRKCRTCERIRTAEVRAARKRAAA